MPGRPRTGTSIIAPGCEMTISRSFNLKSLFFPCSKLRILIIKLGHGGAKGVVHDTLQQTKDSNY